MFPIIVSLPDTKVVTMAKASVPALLPAKRAELKRERAPQPRPLGTENDEHLADDRDSLRPSEFVQRKLQSALHACPVPVSVMHSKRFVRRPEAQSDKIV